MSKKIKLLVLICAVPLISACGVELKDKNEPTPAGGQGKPQVQSNSETPERPREFVLNEKVVLTKNTTWSAERVFLGENAEVVTGTFELKIDAGEFHAAPNAQILNFNSRAELDKQGRHGGAIFIRAQNAKGVLRVHLKGEDGGVGRPGAITNYGGHPGCAGSDGRNGGNAGNLLAEFEESQNFELQILNDVSQAGAGGIRGSVAKYSPNAMNPPCLADSPEGKEGKSGNKGLACVRKSSGTEMNCGN